MLIVNGIAILPDLPTFLAFAAAGLALNLVPGADMTFVAATSARGGIRPGLAAALGVSAGSLLHLAAAVVGLSALVASSEAVFVALKWAGAAYLLYIAVDLIRSGSREVDADLAPPPRSSAFRGAVMINLLNPKVVIFFVAFLPQFVDPAARVPAVQILALGLWFILVATIVNGAVALAAARAAHQLRQVSWIARAARWIAATIMGAMALRLVLAER